MLIYRENTKYATITNSVEDFYKIQGFNILYETKITCTCKIKLTTRFVKFYSGMICKA